MKTEHTVRAGDTLDIRRLCDRLVASPGFGRAVFGLILFNAVVLNNLERARHETVEAPSPGA